MQLRNENRGIFCILYGNAEVHTSIITGHGQRQADHVRRPGGLQHPDALGECGAGGDDVVDEQEALSGDGVRVHRLVSAQHIGPALRRVTDTGLGRVVLRLEYDPNRSANIALVQYEDGEKRYIVAPVGLAAGDKVISSAAADIKPGNCLPIANIPVGTVIHNIEMHPGKGAQLVRSAGAYAQLMAKEGDNAQIRMPSGEVRIIRTNCKACIGQVGNLEHENIQIGKAGRKRHMGWRPTVRGSVMNPCDHPHGGGEGKSPVGRPGPVTPWGKPALGYKTRKKKNPTDKFIVKRRNVK